MLTTPGLPVPYTMGTQAHVPGSRLFRGDWAGPFSRSLAQPPTKKGGGGEGRGAAQERSAEPRVPCCLVSLLTCAGRYALVRRGRGRFFVSLTARLR